MPVRLIVAAMLIAGGNGTSGELGNGESDSKNYPVLVVDGESSTTALADIVQVGAGEILIALLSQMAVVFCCWGIESYGRLGNNETTGQKNYPVPVLDSAGATASAITAISKIALGDESCVCAKR